jgi:putative SbcD/Mre11-related phosphoesterase
MELFKGVEIIESFPALYIKQLRAVVIADLHLGFEGIAAEQGIFMPKIQFKKELEVVKKIAKKHPEAEKIIINGDLKHEFSETTYHEFAEVKEMLKFLSSTFKEIIFVKGNHDNFIARVTSRFSIPVHEVVALENFLFFHGHKMSKETSTRKEGFVVIAHEHPALALYDEVGGREKLKCFLYGFDENLKKNIIVLPAFSYLAQGSDVNIVPKGELLSPLFKIVDVDGLNAVGVSEEAGILEFGKIKEMRE